MNRAWTNRNSFLWQHGGIKGTVPAVHPRKHGLAKACPVLFNGNEFVFID